MNKTKQIESLKKQIKDIEETIFLIDMVDHWTSNDYQIRQTWETKLTKVKGLLIEAIAESVEK